MRQNILIDADDTLWENNVYFEEAFDSFIAFLNHSRLTAMEIRAALDEVELANIKVNGYGARFFGVNLCQCYERLVERDIAAGDRDTIMALAENIVRQPIELIEGVEATLDYLSKRHDLTLFTKGHPEEQKLKIDRSGLGVYFGHTAIVREKDAEAYRALAQSRELDPENTWMVGNSPKSDIIPALAAGFKAVYVPHPRTWHLEKTELPGTPASRLKTVESFVELKSLF